MIAFVDAMPVIELRGEHFLLTAISGDDRIQLMLTAKSFYLLKAECASAFAKRQIADLEAREKVVRFRQRRRAKIGAETTQC